MGTGNDNVIDIVSWKTAMMGRAENKNRRDMVWWKGAIDGTDTIEKW